MRYLSRCPVDGSARLIDGRAMSREIFDEVKIRCDALRGTFRAPFLAAVMVGHDDASALYVRNKIRAADYTGF